MSPIQFKVGHPIRGESLATSLKSSLDASFLDENIEALKIHTELAIDVCGFASDHEGSKADQMALSKRRAKLVYGYMVAHGILASRIHGPQGFGSAYPADTNDTEAGQQRNARVYFDCDIQVLKGQTTPG